MDTPDSSRWPWPLGSCLHFSTQIRKISLQQFLWSPTVGHRNQGTFDMTTYQSKISQIIIGHFGPHWATCVECQCAWAPPTHCHEWRLDCPACSCRSLLNHTHLLIQSDSVKVHSLQSNHYDCGLWVLASIAAVLRGYHATALQESDMITFWHSLYEHFLCLVPYEGSTQTITVE